HNVEATQEHDRLFDAYKIITSSNPLLPQVYSITPTGVKLGINGLPETDLVAMGMIAGIPGEYTISAIETSEFENVILEDLAEGTKTNLLTGSYTFTTGINEPENRFIVHFTPMAVPENVAELISVWSSGNEIKVNAPAGTNGLIHVYNVMGQEIVTSAISGNTTTIPVKNSAYYIVEVINEGSVVTKKVFVK
ncbi:MAG: T9SS type A sorting domain-containing protein, partial [Bacteroidetes bacterium]|nr:T9SS type A sorting domain-containing protein [Bacteroidota bacterium]